MMLGTMRLEDGVSGLFGLSLDLALILSSDPCVVSVCLLVLGSATLFETRKIIRSSLSSEKYYEIPASSTTTFTDSITEECLRL